MLSAPHSVGVGDETFCCMVVDKQRVGAQVGCHGFVDFASPQSVHVVVNSIKTVVDGDKATWHVPGLTTPTVQQGSNRDSAVEFAFKPPIRLAGVWLPEQVGSLLSFFIQHVQLTHVGLFLTTDPN